jgi:hypothetical protein
VKIVEMIPIVEMVKMIPAPGPRPPDLIGFCGGATTGRSQ